MPQFKPNLTSDDYAAEKARRHEDIFKSAEDLELTKLNKLKDTYAWAADKYLETKTRTGKAFDASDFSSKTMNDALHRSLRKQQGYRSGGLVRSTGYRMVHKGEGVLTAKEMKRELMEKEGR